VRQLVLSALFFILILTSTLTVFYFYDTKGGGSQALEPAYFSTMKRGTSLERTKDYRGAIKQYQLALKQVEGVGPDMIRQGKIAAHNRMAACYRDLGNTPKAIEELKISLKLGDKKYARKAIDKLRRQQ
jgi:hypothetical protein